MMRKLVHADDYNRIIPKAWGDFPKFDKPEPKILRSAVKGVWRKLVGKPCKLAIVIGKRGRLRRRYNPAKLRYELIINPREGWFYTMHDLTHFLHRRLRPGEKPHCARHLEMERQAAEYCVRRFGPCPKR